MSRLTELPGFGDPPPVSGHAIETRIYAEDPDTLLPSPGSIDLLEVPNEPWLRLDAGVASGDEVSHFYDPLMAKLIVHGSMTGPKRSSDCVSHWTAHGSKG